MLAEGEDKMKQNRIIKWFQSVFHRIWNDVKQIKWVILGIAIYWIATRVLFRNFCPMVLISGLPCAGCGMTRAMLRVLSLDFKEAWILNPAIYFWVLWGIWAIVWRYFLGRKIAYKNMTLGIVLAITMVVYVYRMLVEFPADPPMSYRYDNLFANVFPWYKNLLKCIWPL
jgi:hypothetical protein